MRKSLVLDSVEAFVAEFARCCHMYKSLSMAIAWCGNPNQTLPYKYLEGFKGSIKATVGIAFNHTHPDAIEWFRDIGSDIRVFQHEADLFHPKIYLFRDNHRYALFVGSSNLTFGGFYTNWETNCLIEGTMSPNTANDIDSLEKTLLRWHSPNFSFHPTAQWIQVYRRKYEATARKLRKQGILTPQRAEEEISTACWLRHADWKVYYNNVLTGLKKHERNGQGYHDV